MNLLSSALTLPLIIVGAIFLFLLFLYNSLVRLRIRVKEAWSGIDVQLKRRAGLIPNLVETVKGYAKHEKTVFENVTKARAAMLSATGPQEKAQAENMLSSTLKSLFAVAEAYPKLQASENFKQLQDELSDTESKIAYSRQFYNANVRDYNTKIATFPNVLLAGMFGFKEEEFFEAVDEERKPVKVDFDK